MFLLQVGVPRDATTPSSTLKVGFRRRCRNGFLVEGRSPEADAALLAREEDRICVQAIFIPPPTAVIERRRRLVLERAVACNMAMVFCLFLVLMLKLMRTIFLKQKIVKWLFFITG